MNLIQKFISFFSKKNLDNTPTESTCFSTFNPYIEGFNIGDNSYITNSSAYSCIQLIIETGMLANWTQPDDVNNPDLQRILSDPMPRISFSMLVGTIIAHLMTRGNAYLEVVRLGTRIERFNIHHPDNVSLDIRQNSFKDVNYYKLDDARRIPVEDMIHFLLPNPSDLWRGLSPLDSLKQPISIDKQASDWQLESFTNRSQPSGILSSKVPLSLDQSQQLRDSVDKGIAGIKNANKMMILPNDINFQPWHNGARD